jgi:hypothetical protein
VTEITATATLSKAKKLTGLAAVVRAAIAAAAIEDERTMAEIVSSVLSAWAVDRERGAAMSIFKSNQAALDKARSN